jgi:hypothetical protein
MVALGLVAFLLSAGPGYALATGPGPPPPGGDADLYADWSMTQTRSRGIDGENGDVVDIDVPEHNVTSLTVTLTWTDDEIVNVGGFRADVLTLLVEPPSTLDQDVPLQSGTESPLSAHFDPTTVPTDDNPKNLKDHDFTNATGRWRVSVTVDANGIRDQGNAWSLMVTYTYYVGRLLPKPGGA